MVCDQMRFDKSIHCNRFLKKPLSPEKMVLFQIVDIRYLGCLVWRWFYSIIYRENLKNFVCEV